MTPLRQRMLEDMGPRTGKNVITHHADGIHAGLQHHCADDDGNPWRAGGFAVVRTEIGQIIVADVDRERVGELVRPDGEHLAELIRKSVPQQP